MIDSITYPGGVPEPDYSNKTDSYLSSQKVTNYFFGSNPDCLRSTKGFPIARAVIPGQAFSHHLSGSSAR